MLVYTVFLPYTAYCKIRDKINNWRYTRIMEDKEKYKGVVLQEILHYMIKKDMPDWINKTGKYLIYKDERNDFVDIVGDFHLKDFINIWSYGGRKIHNKKAIRYYRACVSKGEDVEYGWFMNEIEKHFKQYEDMEVKKGRYKVWGDQYEYILLTIN